MPIGGAEANQHKFRIEHGIYKATPLIPCDHCAGCKLGGAQLAAPPIPLQGNYGDSAKDEQNECETRSRASELPIASVSDCEVKRRDGVVGFRAV